MDVLQAHTAEAGRRIALILGERRGTPNYERAETLGHEKYGLHYSEILFCVTSISYLLCPSNCCFLCSPSPRQERE